jgi:2,4-dienoyl-CoA reductase-like NADH-dependent reductase (Old Yellow Enzyme family)
VLGAFAVIVKPGHVQDMADEISRQGQADLAALGRKLLRHSRWTLDAAHTPGQEMVWPCQYQRAKLFSGF